MSGEAHEECGVAAVCLANRDEEKALFYLYRMMLNLQHRIVKGSRMLICTSCIKTLQKEKTPV